MSTERRALPGLLACLLLGAGCSSGPRVALAGEVTFEGQPLPQGTIVFIPVDARSSPATGCDIVNGKYEVPSAKGAVPEVTYRVEIAALARSGKFIPNPFDPKGPPVELDANYLPASYNTRSGLQVTVKSGTNRFDFDLKKDGTVPSDAAGP